MARINLLHPSFAPSFEGLDQAIRHGVGQAKREYGKVFGKYSRKAGDDLVTPYFPSRLAVYEGWSEARKYRPIPNAKETFPLPSHHLQFFVQMSRKNRTKELIMPSFALKISQDTYIQPAGEPKAEDLQSRTYSRSGIRSYYNYFTKRTEYYAYTNSDTYFSTAYMVTFDLFSSDGTPILKPDDEEVILVLVLQGEEKRVKFKLSDWTINRVTRGKE